MSKAPNGIKVNSRSGLPQYCVRKTSGGNRVYYYFQKNEFRTRLPEFGSSGFWDEYMKAREAMEDSPGLSESEMISTIGMTKNELDKYFYALETGARQRAKAAGREYTLPKYWGADRYVEQEGRCALSGVVMRKGQGRMDPYSPSIDRIDSSKGYTPENCQIVLHRVNIAKGDMCQNEFIKLCRTVLSFQRQTERERK